MADEFSRELKCKLTDHEVAERSALLATRLEDRDAVDAERAKTAKKYKRILDGLQAEIADLALQVRTRSETRDVQCRTDRFADGTVVVVRLDTGEVLQTRHPERGDQLPLAMMHVENMSQSEAVDAEYEDVSEVSDEPETPPTGSE